VAVARDGAPTAPGNPPSRNVVTAAWQRGFDRFVVSTRETGPDPGRWTDPFRPPGSRGDARVEPTIVSSGVAAGARGEVVVTVGDPPYAWTVNDRFLVTVSGDLSPDELLDVLRSLRAMP
jgi:hypothetical protein